jgi:hypothetical protein
MDRYDNITNESQIKLILAYIPKNTVGNVKSELKKRNVKQYTRIYIYGLLRGMGIKDIFTMKKIYNILDTTAISSKSIECVICLCTKNRHIKLTCKHEFCSDCLSRIEKKGRIKCPLCRHKSNSKLLNISTNKEHKHCKISRQITQDEYNNIRKFYMKTLFSRRKLYGKNAGKINDIFILEKICSILEIDVKISYRTSDIDLNENNEIWEEILQFIYQ